MGYYEALDEVEDVQSGELGVDETREWIMEDRAIRKWFKENPRYISGPRFEDVEVKEDTVITGKQIGRWTMQICSDDLPNNVQEFLEDSRP